MLPGATQLPDSGGVALRRARAPVAAMVPDYPAVLRAPIFNPGRTPGEASAAGDGAAVAASLQVLGVATSGSGGSAVVRGADGASRVLKVGQTLQGWRLLAVLPDAAVFSAPGGRTVLQVGAHDLKPTTTADPAPPPPSPSAEPPP